MCILHGERRGEIRKQMDKVAKLRKIKIKLRKSIKYRNIAIILSESDFLSCNIYFCKNFGLLSYDENFCPRK